ncbi:MAG: hypothetical protein NZ957_00450 [Thaumarchaeota archaeon]|nr:hypothetical protein [Candidatus Calditenuaceae archaeon]MDW8041248.1 hypothetical protein [Nitrososphaerota archaeon]
MTSRLQKRFGAVERKLRRLARSIERRSSERGVPLDWKRLEMEVWTLVQESYSLSQAARSEGDLRTSQACVGVALRGLALLSRLRRDRELEEIRALVEQIEGEPS